MTFFLPELRVFSFSSKESSNEQKQSSSTLDKVAACYIENNLTDKALVDISETINAAVDPDRRIVSS